MLHTHTSSPAHHAQLPSSSINYPSCYIQTHLLLLLLLCPGDVLMPATTPWCLPTPSRELQAQLNLRHVILRHPHPSLHATAWKPRQDEPPSPKEQLPDSPLSSPFPIFFLLLGLFCFFFFNGFCFPWAPLSQTQPQTKGDRAGAGAGGKHPPHVHGSPNCLSVTAGTKATEMVCTEQKVPSENRLNTIKIPESEIDTQKHLNASTLKTSFVYYPVFEELFLCYC